MTDQKKKSIDELIDERARASEQIYRALASVSSRDPGDLVRLAHDAVLEAIKPREVEP